MPAFRAARVEQKIVKVPKSELTAALGQSKLSFANSGADLEKDLAIEEEGKKLLAYKDVVQIKDGVQVKGGAGGKVPVPAGAGVSGKAQDAPAADAAAKK